MENFSVVFKALAFAAEKHSSQRRKDADASPYINHPIAVATLLWEVAEVRDVDTLAAAILHDTIEDTETTEEELRAGFGDTITDIVLEVTDDKRLPKAERKQLQVEHAPQKSHEASHVKLADKTCNIGDMADHPPANWNIARRREYVDWAERVVSGLPVKNEALLRRFQELCGVARRRIDADEKG